MTNAGTQDSLRLVVAHDWLVGYAGSERCVAEVVKAFPDASILTSLLRPDRLPPPLRSAQPSFLQRLPGAADHHEWTLPLMPLAWRLRAPITDADADVVLSSSHACAKAVRVDGAVPHVCYCHTPMRYAWDFVGEQKRFPPLLRPPARVSMALFRRWDVATSRRVDHFVANSTAVADRIARYYGRTATVVHPPVRTDFFTPDGTREDFFLYVGRLEGYKRPDLVVDAFAELPFELVVVGEGRLLPTLRRRAGANVRFLGNVDDDTLLGLYRRARALVFAADEDFGIAMAEAQAAGAPVVGLDAGGARDIVRDGETGWLIARQDESLLREAVRQAAASDLDPEAISASAARFSAASFRQRMSELLVAAARRTLRAA